MKFETNKSIEILERTPLTLYNQLNNISNDWIVNNEGEGTWSVYDVIGHLIHGDKTDWMERIEIVLSNKKEFKPFDRFAQFEASKGKTVNQLLNEFITIRKSNLDKLKKLNITENDLLKIGIHPVFGSVTLSQLISTWVVHDLDHTAQIARIMAKQYKNEVGPWIEYLKVLKIS
jgi:uncharacterized damage-inducible protein DinB